MNDIFADPAYPQHPSHSNPFWFEYFELARLARHLLAKRENGYPKLVYAQIMTQDEADAAIHNMTGAATIMHAMIGYSEIGQLPATRWAMHDDLTAAAKRAREMADKHPRSEPHQHTAWGTEAIAYWLQPWDRKTRYASKSLAEHIHNLNLELRAQAKEDRAKRAESERQAA